MKTNTIMPTYEQLAVNNAKLSQEVLRLSKAVERLKKRQNKTERPNTTSTIEYEGDNTGWYVLAIILTIFIFAVGMFIINEKYQVL